MAIVLPFTGGVKTYLREYGNRPPRLLMNCSSCPEQRLWHHGRYVRPLYRRSQVTPIPIYRLYCPKCGDTVSMVPWFLRLHAPFDIWTHVAAAHAYLQGASLGDAAQKATSAENRVQSRTVRRWSRWLDDRAADLTPVLSQRLLELAPGIEPSAFSPRLTASYHSLRTAPGLIRQLRKRQWYLGGTPWNFRKWTCWALCHG